jgi:hypothetical protein
MNQLTTIIFSKDRACQLDSLLQSVHDNITDHDSIAIMVLYRTTNQAFEQAYTLLQSRTYGKNIRWITEKSFKPDLISLIQERTPDDSVMFLVDDTVFFRPIMLRPLLDAFTSKTLFISLRADRNYADDRRHPHFFRETPLLTWFWHTFKRPNTWTYPFSVDGNIFHASFLKKIVPDLTFKAPNSFEGSMHQTRHCPGYFFKYPFAIAPLHAVVFNNPLNKVQREGATWNQDISCEFLNTEYLDGKHIDNQLLYNTIPAATHHSAAIRFIRRS